VVSVTVAAVTLSGRAARVYTTHKDWLGVLMGAAATAERDGGFLV